MSIKALLESKTPNLDLSKLEEALMRGLYMSGKKQIEAAPLNTESNFHRFMRKRNETAPHAEKVKRRAFEFPHHYRSK